MTFADIQNNWAKQQIEALASRTIVQGKTTTTYDPSATMKRSEFTVMMTRAMNLPLNAYKGTFKDVGPSMDWAYAEIEAAQKAGIINGVTALEFKPEQSITRIQAAMMIGRLLEQENVSADKLNAAKKITDIKDLQYFSKTKNSKQIELVLQAGIMNGYSNGTFNPHQELTRDQMAKVLYETLKTLDSIQ